MLPLFVVPPVVACYVLLAFYAWCERRRRQHCETEIARLRVACWRYPSTNQERAGASSSPAALPRAIVNHHFPPGAIITTTRN